MSPADAQLIEQIRQITQGGSRLLVTLARHGKALERDDSQRAAFLLAAVRFHPLYKGGRLAFDMLEIEDLMLDSSPIDLMSMREVIQVLNGGAHRLIEMLREIGSPLRSGHMAVAASIRETDVLGDSLRNIAESTGNPASGPVLPRVSLGPTDDIAGSAQAFVGAAGEGWETRGMMPELQSSDYLYDYVVLGLLDMVGRIS